MKSTTKVQTPGIHLPRFHKGARQMILELGELPVENLVKELKCNDKIVLENKLHYQDFFNEDVYLAILLVYYSQAYKYLKAEEYNLNDFLHADKHFWITSFFYGLLRPLDLIYPYHLEGKTKLPSAEGKSIFDYWRPLLIDMFIETLKADDRILVYLATEESKHFFDWKRLKKEACVIRSFFMVDQGSRLKAINAYTKSCHGVMTSYIIRNQLTPYGDSLDFELDGFTYQPDYGDEEHLHFISRT